MVFTPTTGPGRPAPPQPVVDAGRPGRRWQHPQGPGPARSSGADHPVVHVAHEDAPRTPTGRVRPCRPRREWEYAARGGLDGRSLHLGRRGPAGRADHGQHLGRTRLPVAQHRESGWLRTSPVGSFPANGVRAVRHGRQRVGVDRRTGGPASHPADAATAVLRPGEPAGRRPARRATTRPSRSSAIPRKVIKGGSHLCADSYCLRYRPAARRPQHDRHRDEPRRLPLRAHDPKPAGDARDRPMTDAPAVLATRGRRGRPPGVPGRGRDRPVEDRVACFDNDGTLWCERPTYVQFDFFVDVLAAAGGRGPGSGRAGRVRRPAGR